MRAALQNTSTGRSNRTWVLLLLFLVQFLVTFRPATMAWDGVFYYSATRSAVCDGDLRLGNDLRLSYAARPDPFFEAQHYEQVLTPTGRVASPYAIGTSVLWLPWFVPLALAVRFAVGDTALTCFEWPLVWTMATVTCVYGWLAALIGYRLARRFAGEWAALLAGATAMFTTPLWYYQFREPFYAHAASALTTALFVVAWWRAAERRDARPITAILLGIVGGLAALVRWQNAAYLVLPLLTVGVDVWAATRQRDRRAMLRGVLRGVLVGGGALLVLTVQFAVWSVFYGRALTIPQGNTFMDWRAPWVQHVLFSAFNGLLPWMPVTLPALVGLMRLGRRAPRLGIPLLVAFALQVFINGCAVQWYGGGGYGPRRFSSTLAILVVGYAAFLDWRSVRWYRALGLGVSALLVLHQLLLLRYGFAERIGGHAAPTTLTYDDEWHADPLPQFAQQMAGYLPQAARQPLQTLIQPESPLSTSASPAARQVLLLAGVLGVVGLVQMGWRRWRPHPGVLLVVAVALIAAADWWIVTQG